MITAEERAALIAENARWFARQIPERHLDHVPRSDECRKRAYGSAVAAKAAHASGRFRVRAYQCPRCGKFHVTNGDKHTSWKEGR